MSMKKLNVKAANTAPVRRLVTTTSDIAQCVTMDLCSELIMAIKRRRESFTVWRGEVLN